MQAHKKELPLHIQKYVIIGINHQYIKLLLYTPTWVIVWKVFKYYPR